MKKELLFILLLILALSPVLAIETNIKETYQPGETFILELKGNFLETITPNQVLFYSGRAYIPMLYDIAKIENSYYIYSILPIKQRNYTLIIKDVKYSEQGIEQKKDLSYNFSVSGDTSLFSVNPGFIITSENFNIKAESLVKDITLKAEFLNSTQEKQINLGQTKILYFSIKDVSEYTFTYLTIESDTAKYQIPVAIFKESSEIPKESTLRFSKSNLNITVIKDMDFQEEITLMNTGQEDLEDISLTTDLDSIQIEPINLDIISGNSGEIILKINSNTSGYQEGTITAESGNLSDILKISILVLENQEEFDNITNNSNTEIIGELSCEEQGGIFCESETEQCSGSIRLTIDGTCCIGICEIPSSYGKTTTIIAIVIVLIIIAFFVYKKLKVRQKRTREILREKSDDFEERFKSKETRGTLSKA